MKKLSVIFMLLVGIAHAQFDSLTISPDSKLYEFDRVIETPMPKSELYLVVREWYADAFRSANHVIQMDDKEAGIVVGKGYMDISIGTIAGPMTIKMYFTLTTKIKDDKYRFILTGIYYNYPASTTGGVYSPEKDISAEIILDPETLYKKNGEMKPAKSEYYYSTLEAVNIIYNMLFKHIENNKKQKDW